MNRGKSTLVNSIIGAELSPVNFLPETASVLCFARAPATRAHGITFEGKEKSLSTRPESFAADVSREARKPLLAASYQGNLSLPDGLCVVDTPGAYEAEVASKSLVSSGMPASLHSLCDGFIVVMGVPGVSAIDLQLLRNLNNAVAPSAVRVVLKGLDSSITRSDLKDYASDVLSTVMNEKFIIADSDQRELVSLVNSFRKISSSWQVDDGPHPVASSRSLRVMLSVRQQVTSALQNRREQDEFDFPKQLLKDLPPQIGELVKSFAKGESMRRQEERKEQARRAEKAKRQAEKEQWQAKDYQLNQAVQTAKGSLLAAEKALSSGQPSVGCGPWIFLGLSFFAFPIGPIIAGAVLWFFYIIEEDEFASRRPGLQSQVERAREAVDRATRLHADHQRTKPV